YDYRNAGTRSRGGRAGRRDISARAVASRCLPTEGTTDLAEQSLARPVVRQCVQSLTQVKDERGIGVVPVEPADDLWRQAALPRCVDRGRHQVEAVVELRQEDLAAVAARRHEGLLEGGARIVLA